MAKKILALKYLADGDKNYIPGDQITVGRLYTEAEYYASIGSVRIVDDAVVEPEVVKTETTELDPQQLAALAVVKAQMEIEAKDWKPDQEVTEFRKRGRPVTKVQ